MKKLLILGLLAFSIQNIFSQNYNDDYILFDKFLSTVSNQTSYVVVEESADFNKQDVFFTENFLQSYTEPTIGVDSKKIKKLIKEMNFNYLKAQKRSSAKWELSKSKLKITKFISSSNSNDPTKVYNIARPVYSEDLKLAFVYFQEFCGIDCGSSGVKVFKKCKKGWELYQIIPLSIS